MNLKKSVHESWHNILQFSDIPIHELMYLKKQGYDWYPKKGILRAFKECQFPPKIVIVGQDPYNDGSADGLAFSNSKMTPSLEIINNELHRTFDFKGNITNLVCWAKQGILLLNAALTVEKYKTESHLGLWEDFIIDIIYKMPKETVFFLWGKKAQQFIPVINRNCVVETADHPVAESRGTGTFTGCNHFFNHKYINWICQV